MANDVRHLGDPGSPDFQLENYPFYLLNRTVSRYNAVIGRRLKAIGIDIPAWRVLMVLGEHQPRSIGQVTEAAVVNLSTMMRIVQRMEAGGLVTSGPGRDGRVTEVQMTKAGRQKLDEARRATAPIYAQVIRGFSLREFEALIALLNRLHDNLGDVDQTPAASAKVSR